MKTSDDIALGQALRDGSEAALGTLYDHHLPGIYDFLSRFLRDRFVAEDLAQVTFVRAWEARESLQDPGRVRSWLYTIAHNLAINHVTRSRRTESIDDQLDLATTAPGPEDRAAAKEMADLVWAAAASLEPRQYAVLDLSVRRDLPTGEIAQALDVPAAHAAVLVNRAKEALGNAVSYLLVARRRDHCGRLAELVPEGAASLTPDQRSSVDRHLRRCPACQGLARTLTSPAELFGALLPVPVPTSLSRDGRDFLLVAARRQREEEARLLGPRPSQTRAGSGLGAPRRRISRKAVIAGIAGVALLVLAVGADGLYLHRPRPMISVPRASADLSTPSPSVTPTPSWTPGTGSPPADSSSAGDGSPALPGGARPGAGQGSGVNESGAPGTRGGPNHAGPPGSGTPSPQATAAPNFRPTSSPKPGSNPAPTSTPAPSSSPGLHGNPAPAATPTPTPTPSPPAFAVTQISLAGQGGPGGGCAKAPAGYRCDFTVVVAYSNAQTGSAIVGSLTATSTSPAGQADVRTKDFAVSVAPGTGSVTVPVSVFFSGVSCPQSSSAAAVTSQPNRRGSAAVGFGGACKPS